MVCVQKSYQSYCSTLMALCSILDTQSEEQTAEEPSSKENLVMSGKGMLGLFIL